MKTLEFLDELGLPQDADIDQVERAFVEQVKACMQRVVENYDEKNVKKEESWLRVRFKAFFNHSLDWIKQEHQAHAVAKEPEESLKLKKEAQTVIIDLQKYIVEFASCYLHINRFMTLLRDEIREEEMKLSGEARNVQWTPDSGAVIARYRKEKKGLTARMERMDNAADILRQAEDYFETIRAGATSIFGKEKAEPLMRSLTAALRTSDYEKAKKALKSFEDTKKKFSLDSKGTQKTQDEILEAGQKLVKLVQDNDGLLKGDDKKLLLRPMEADMTYNANVRELQKIKAFLSKYHLPYMQYKLDALYHLKDKLLVLNSLESLMTLYKRLIAGLARPMTDVKVIRFYEGEVLNHVKYLLQGHFQELPNIQERAEETVQEFRENKQELEIMQQMDLSEIDVGDKQSAQA